MTVGELRKALEGVPDEAEVLINIASYTTAAERTELATGRIVDGDDISANIVQSEAGHVLTIS